MLTMYSINYNGHNGTGDKNSYVVKFYGLKFDNIIQAIKILRYVKPDEYTGVYFGTKKKIKGLIRKSDGKVMVMTYPSFKRRIISSLTKAEYYFGKSSI